jgi:hypothetical protein
LAGFELSKDGFLVIVAFHPPLGMQQSLLGHGPNLVQASTKLGSIIQNPRFDATIRHELLVQDL